jgi:hypothetical protein
MTDKFSTPQEIAEYVCRQLSGKVIIHRYDAYSTNSIYLKFDYGVANSLRISDHPGKRHLAYRYNIDFARKHYKIKYSPQGYPRYYYPVSAVDRAIKDILDAKRAKGYRYKDYGKLMEEARLRSEHEKGFWQQARLVMREGKMK